MRRDVPGSSARLRQVFARFASSRRRAPTAGRCSLRRRISRQPWWTGFEGRCYDPRLPPLHELAVDPPMKSESLVFAAAGTLVGFLGGWIIGSQHTIARAPAAGVAASAPAPATSPGNAPSAPALGTAKVQAATGRASA